MNKISCLAGLTILGLGLLPLASLGMPTSGGGHEAMHSHETIEVPPGQPAPTIALEVTPDKKRGYNLRINTTNFQFTPRAINTPSNVNTGHAHLYINGKMFTRVYCPDFFLPQLAPGRNEIKVTLNGNNHDQIVYQGKPVAATVVVEVPGK
ncbi:hypothetical protein RIF25_03010 [Thermosynechococcaceae cyanobacterium BACA0444]|uniref:Uncharacterized protein n=1 Tax=Pseudocalidococcus azoricus BACA0444 TaxID=2918990 RepID=A0AAE4FR77_9CYAN|nr:hypothetical protein [Pseudocalidococcus azoricus]MDS3859772.1 hypothetical protein [Pseudocalidococcus azoricus BACA0444]